MKMFLIFLLLLPGLVLGQASTPNDTFKVGQGSSSSDKGIIFDTNDGVSNKSLKVEKVSKNLKFDGNTFQLGDGSSSSDKTILINGASKSLKYNGTAGQFEFDQMLQITGGLKTNTISPRTGTENTFSQDVRATGKVFVGAGNNQLRVNSGNLEFSNDGSLFKKVGSGSGQSDSGVNLLENASFEDGLTPGWTNVGGTFTQQTYTNSTEGDTKYARFVASGSGQYFESIAKVITDGLAGGCLAYFKYKTSDNNAFKVSFFSSGSEISFQNLPTTNGAWLTTPYVPVSCPSAGELVKVRGESLAAGTLEVDKGYLGSENRLVKASGNFLIGRVVFGTDCNMQRATNATFSDFPVDSTCTITPAGRALTPTTNIPAIRFGQLNAGTYQVVVSGPIACGLDAAGDCRGTLRIFDGVNESRELLGTETTQNSVTGGDESTGNTYVFTMVLPSNQSNVQFNLQGRTSLGSQIFNYSGDSLSRSSISVFALQTESDFAVTNDQSGWFIDANIGGANPSLGIANVASYTEISNASLDMVLRPGSAPAQIGCSGTNPPTGLTCGAGNESLAVAWTPPFTGYFDVCFSFAHRSQASAAGTVGTTFQVVSTPTNAQTILSEGGARVSRSINTSTADNLTIMPYPQLCGTFLVSSVTQQMTRLMFEQAVSGTITDSLIIADRGASLGQQDVRVTVRPSTMNVARPVLTGDTVTAPGTTRTKQFGFRSSAACTTGNCPGSFFGNILSTGSVVFTSTGVYTVTIPGGTCSSSPFCSTGIQPFTSTQFRCSGSVSSNTSLQVNCLNNTPAAVNEGFTFMCWCE